MVGDTGGEARGKNPSHMRDRPACRKEKTEDKVDKIEEGVQLNYICKRQGACSPSSSLKHQIRHPA